MTNFAYGAVLIFVSSALTLRDHGYGANASRGMPVYVSAFAGCHYAYPLRMDGQAGLPGSLSYNIQTKTVYPRTASKILLCPIVNIAGVMAYINKCQFSLDEAIRYE